MGHGGTGAAQRPAMFVACLATTHLFCGCLCEQRQGDKEWVDGCDEVECAILLYLVGDEPRPLYLHPKRIQQA